MRAWSCWLTICAPSRRKTADTFEAGPRTTCSQTAAPSCRNRRGRRGFLHTIMSRDMSPACFHPLAFELEFDILKLKKRYGGGSMFSLFDGLFDGFWGFFILLPAAGIGCAVLLVCALCIVFSIPYAVWCGWESPRDIPTISESNPLKGLMHEAANAFRLYRSWITKKPHGIRYFTK